MFAIGVLSTTVLIVSQVYMVSKVYWGLMSRRLGEKICLSVPGTCLLKQLRDNGGLRLLDWVLLFPGVCIFGQMSSGTCNGTLS